MMKRKMIMVLLVAIVVLTGANVGTINGSAKNKEKCKMGANICSTKTKGTNTKQRESGEKGNTIKVTSKKLVVPNKNFKNWYPTIAIAFEVTPSTNKTKCKIEGTAQKNKTIIAEVNKKKYKCNSKENGTFTLYVPAYTKESKVTIYEKGKKKNKIVVSNLKLTKHDKQITENRFDYKWVMQEYNRLMKKGIEELSKKTGYNLEYMSDLEANNEKEYDIPNGAYYSDFITEPRCGGNSMEVYYILDGFDMKHEGVCFPADKYYYNKSYFNKFGGFFSERAYAKWLYYKEMCLGKNKVLYGDENLLDNLKKLDKNKKYYIGSGYLYAGRTKTHYQIDGNLIYSYDFLDMGLYAVSEEYIIR